jgi:hypothetical protein
MTSNLYPDFFNDLNRLRLPTAPADLGMGTTPTLMPSPPKPKRIKGEFLKGPIPLNWLTAAAKLRGKAPLTVALAIWFEAGRKRSKEIRLTAAILRRFGVNRKAKYTALASLENAGLVRIQRRPRKNPIVTVLDLPDEGKGRADDDAD